MAPSETRDTTMTLTISREKMSSLPRPCQELHQQASTLDLSMEKDVQVFVDAVVSSLPITDAGLDKIKHAQHNDDPWKTVAGYCLTEWSKKHEVGPYIATYWQAKIELYLVGDLLVKEEKFYFRL